MRSVTFGFFTALTVWASPALAAKCMTEGDASAAVIDTTKPDTMAGVVVDLSVYLMALQNRQFNRDLIAAAESGCQRVVFEALGTRFVLKQENGQTPQRAAISVDPTQPLSYLIVVPDFAVSMGGDPEAKHGYALMTFGPAGDHVAWRVYNAIPTDAVLSRDVADALEGRLRRIMSWKDGRVTIGVGAIKPKSGAN